MCQHQKPKSHTLGCAPTGQDLRWQRAAWPEREERDREERTDPLLAAGVGKSPVIDQTKMSRFPLKVALVVEEMDYQKCALSWR
jgi:hypothetical protein